MPRRTGSKVRWLLIVGFIYMAYRFLNNGSADDHPADPPTGSSTTDETTPADNEHSFFLFSIIGFFFGAIATVFSWIGGVISFLWSVIWSIWTIAMLVLNGGFTFISYYIGKSGHQASVEYFFCSLVLVVVVPTIINRLLVSEVVAYNLMLPIYLTSFVDINANQRNPC